MKSRVLFSISILVIFATLLPANIDAQEEVTIRFMHHEARYSQEINDAIEAFEEAYPNINVEPELVPWVDSYALLINQFETDSLPDVFITGNTWVSPMAEIGMLSDITERMTSWERDGVPILEDVYSGDALFYSLDGRWYGLPQVSYPRQMIIRTDWLEELGLEPPTNHEEFLEVARAMTDPEKGRWGFGLMGSPDGVTFQNFVNFAIQRGAYLFREDEDGNLVSNIDSPEYIEAIRWYTDLLLEEGIAPPGAAAYSSGDVESAFQGGAIGMHISSPHFVPALEENTALEGKWEVVPTPGGPVNDVLFLGGWPLVMSSTTEHPEETWEFMKFMVGREALLPYLDATGAPPAYKSLADEWAGDDTNRQLYVQGLERAQPNSYPFEAPSILASMTDGEMPLQFALQAVLNGEMTPEEAAADAHAKVNEMLERARGE